MAPRQTTLQQSEAIVRQILTLVDALDYKTLMALFNLYVDRIKREEELITSLGKQNKPIDELTIASHKTAYYNMKMVQLINRFKKARQQLREEYLEK